MMQTFGEILEKREKMETDIKEKIKNTFNYLEILYLLELVNTAEQDDIKEILLEIIKER